ncbi:PucR family transcriptional regulator [Leekyejoonella antrihumi]|nr:PucR family transcriptional regulator [Leekyejoonella antrihumi]
MTPTLSTRERLERHAGALSTAATQRMEEAHDWYRSLSAEDRSWVGLVAQAGIGAFIAWYRDRSTAPPITSDVFGTAPRELTRSITLRQTLDLVRTVIDVVEHEVPQVAAPGQEQQLREAVLIYSREVAFSAAEVYAQAAESRGAWDARLEALVIDAVLRGEADEALRSRVSALGWDEVRNVIVVAGKSPAGPSAEVVDALRRAAARQEVDALVSVQGRRLVGVLGNVDEPIQTVERLQGQWADGPLVIGPLVPHLYAAGRSARAALSGHTAAPAWSEAPRPCLAEELLPERALAGDVHARRLLVDRVARPLRSADTLRETVQTYLSERSLEATARLMFVHPNTVRYRLGRVAALTGYDLGHSRDAFCVRLALAYSHLAI